MISLRSKITQKILNLFFLNEKEKFYVNELAKKIIQINSSERLIYLKSKFKVVSPYIEFWEIWKNDNRYKYSYRFVVPFFNFVYAFDGVNSKCRLNNFQFRYEIHPESTFPENHMHFFDSNWNPHYPTHDIKFPEFFEIITREFVDSNQIDFDY